MFGIGRPGNRAHGVIVAFGAVVTQGSAALGGTGGFEEDVVVLDVSVPLMVEGSTDRGIGGKLGGAAESSADADGSGCGCATATAPATACLRRSFIDRARGLVTAGAAARGAVVLLWKRRKGLILETIHRVAPDFH